MPNGEQSVSDKSVRATLNYSLDGAERPQIFNGEHERNVLHLKSSDITISDGGCADLSLNKEGFCRVQQSSDIGNHVDDEEAMAVYREDLRAMMLEITGADDVLMFPHSVTRRQQPQGDAQQAASPPIMFVHSDYTRKGAEQNLAVYGDLPQKPRRTALFNMWKLLSKGPTDSPLALCDASSVREEDIIAGDSHYPKYGGFALETAFIKANPDHKWYFFPDLTDQEILVFKQGDSSSAFPGVVPHTAFDNRANAPQAAPRVSIESRCLAVWY